ncbi:hypothetical protein J4207_05855 [Candidatus Woesearchaeota archaeon]|nr:hypothetical protein [Candidatus Woesearchaeota archaeon]
MGLFDTPEEEEGGEEKPAEEKKLKSEIESVAQKYKQKIDEHMEITGSEEPGTDGEMVSRDYQSFREEYVETHQSWYEKCCAKSEKILKIKPDPAKIEEYQEAIKIAHLKVTIEGVYSFAMLTPIIVALGGSLITFALFQSLFFIFFFLVVGAAIMKPLQNIPFYLANGWRMKASNQMVLCIFYVVTYMRHTSNLELAIAFASEHLAPPLSLDLKKVFWDVETEKYESIKESLDAYLMTWKKWDPEFIEAFHLVESSLYEGDETRRLEMLDKSLSVILDGTYEKMLHYAQNLKSPVMMLHMLGVILPILGLVILPLMVSFVCQVKWYHIMALYDFALPVGVFFLAKNILASRPTGYGDSDPADEPELRKFRNIIFHLGKKEILLSPLYVSLIVGGLLILIGFSPLILHLFAGDSNWDLILHKEGGIAVTNKLEDPNAKMNLLGYQIGKGCNGVGVGEPIGPYGIGASMLSLLVTLGLALSAGLYYKLSSKNVIEIRERSKQLENEFASALFQLGNRLGDGLPAEIAFGKVADSMQGTVSGNFFQTVSQNITRLGMSVHEAIFDPEHGALKSYPSKVIESSMKVLSESSKKGPKIAAQALINVARYIKEIHAVNERLKDLMSEIISSMKSQIKFLTPAIAGIVIGITAMITTILGKLGGQLRSISSAGGQPGSGAGLLALFGDSVPPFYFQVVVGIYVVEIIYILTIVTNGIEEGADQLSERYNLGMNLTKSVTTYIVIAGIVMLLFNLLAVSILKGIAV